ncbi:MAG: DEAD/DEAH box helicase [Gammaproteobacteria bacterium]|nr:DEAD/DEAH box helicase [Gammaproteobacteria bacterium]
MTLPFHPIVERWFTETLGAPLPAQERAWAAIRDRSHTLLAAPTGSGKTLAAFLNAIDELLREGLEHGLENEVRVLYISPLKALSADIHKNLEEPLAAIRERAVEAGLPAVRIRSAVRTGDTPSSSRAAMLRTPPHILVTTPESLYLLLTAERSRAMLRTVRTVIVDEIHAVIDSRRGSHLALSLERLGHVTGRPLQRIGLSATQKPVSEVARFLLGSQSDCTIIDEGHRRAMDLAVEVPPSPMEAVMSHEVWSEVYERLTESIEAHKTTLVFVNTRRMAERLAARLTDRLGEEAVTAHHGSLSREARLNAEDRLRAGTLKALVATASLELGIDIGHVDLVCQIGSPRWISTFLQRVGRSGHTVRGTPKGRLFPLSRDDLVECAALVRAVNEGELDRLIMMPQPLDVLAQQTVAETASEPWCEDELYDLWRGAYPYRELAREHFDEVVQMVAEGFVTRRGRRGALVHRDRVNGRIKGRRAARLTAITAGGAIPDNADYRVVLDPEETFIGTLNEDFAIESSAGDIFQLGNTSWRILAVNSGTVRVADAHGEPPTIPFWLGEAPGRSAELSSSVARLRADVEARLDGEDEDAAAKWLEELGLSSSAARQIQHYLREAKHILGALPTQDTLVLERFFDEAGGMQMILHAPFGSRVNRAWGLALRKKFCRQFNFELQAAATEEGVLLSLGPQHSFPLEDVFRYVHPDTLERTLVQALIDSPVFPTRWRWNATISLAVLRNRAGRKVPPPLQRMEADDLMAAAFPEAAACLENIGGDREIPDHPLVRQTLRDCLEEAMAMGELDRVLRRVFSGEIRYVTRDTPEPSVLSHEILNSAPYSFLDDAPLEERRARAVQTRRAFEPSSADELGALDPAAIQRVREEVWPDPRDADELHDALLTAGVLTAAEGEGGNGDAAGNGRSWRGFFEELCATGRAGRLGVVGDAGGRLRPHVAAGADRSEAGAGDGEAVLHKMRKIRKTDGANAHEALAADGVEPEGPAWWVSAERLPEVLAVAGPEVRLEPALTPPADLAAREWSREDAVRELVRGRLQMCGPVTAGEMARTLAVGAPEVEAALLALEGEGFVLRGAFTSPDAGGEWCERRLLARIHRYTLNRLRAEIRPVSQADFMRFLFAWQRVAEGEQAAGVEGLAGVLAQLEGFETCAGAWEADVLGRRVASYDPGLLDAVCMAGRVTWARISPPAGNGPPVRGPLPATPIAFLDRSRMEVWLRPGGGPSAVGADPVAGGDPSADGDASLLSAHGRAVHDVLATRGASFFHELVGASGLLPTRVEEALGELVAAGLATADSFTGLRALLVPSDRRKPLGPAPHASLAANAVGAQGRTGRRGGRNRRRSSVAFGVDSAGRWSLLRRDLSGRGGGAGEGEEAVAMATARVLLRRYGVLFRRLLDNEPRTLPWWRLVRALRRMEARGDVRGGRFVTGVSGEQFALPEAVGLVRRIRRKAPSGRPVPVSAADPLNLTGILTPGPRIAKSTRSRVVYRDGVPVAAHEGSAFVRLGEYEDAVANQVERAARIGSLPPALRSYMGRKRRAAATGRNHT